MRLKGSVGDGGRNLPGDVQYVQILVCDWLVARGMQAIDIDDMSGPETIGAIKQFQRLNTAVVDGLVEVSRSTIRALEFCHINNIAGNSQLSYRVIYRTRYKTYYTPSKASPQQFWNKYLDALRG
jgi:hypothetical protein